MIGTIRRFDSPDVDNLSTWQPAEPDCFGFLLQIMVGPASEEGEESFGIEVCTPAWLARKYGPHGIISGRHHLIVFEYEFKTIESYLRDYVASCSADTWQEVAAKIGRLGHWEFEDYRP